MEFSALIYGVRDCGEHIGRTKKKFYWIFRLGEKGHTIELFFSILNGKKKLLLDQKEIYQGQKSRNLFKRILSENFQFSFVLQGYKVKIQQNRNDFSCFIDGIQFKTLADQKRKLLKECKDGIEESACDMNLTTMGWEQQTPVSEPLMS